MNDQRYLDNIFNEIDKDLKLDEEQKRVILDESNHLIVVAGAGSGKTLTLVAKVKYLVEIKKIKPDEILIISLTNKAIEELKERINVKSGIPIMICTFHKLAYDMLKKEDIRYRINNNTNEIFKKIILKMPNTRKIIKDLRKDEIYKKSDNNSLNDIDTLCNFTNEIIKLIKILKLDINSVLPQYKITKKYLGYLQYVYYEYNKAINEKYELDFEDLILKASDIKKTFLDYQSQMKARMIKIVNTYRNSQQLIDVAGKFIMKNNNQIKKKLHSKKKLDKPIKIYGYERNMNRVFENIMEKLVERYGVSKNILVLGRYKSDVFKIKSNKFIIKGEKIIYKKNLDVEIRFMTIHASKGLGFDNVILINFSNEYMGFPSNIKDSLIKKDIFKMEDNVEEERRLFYVALTRTKNEIFILVEKKKESLFIEELYDNKNVYIDYDFKILKKYLKHKIK